MSPKILIIEQGFIQQDAICFLQSLGYNIDFFLIDNNFTYKRKFYHKYINIFKRLFLKDNSYWTNLDIKHKNKHYLRQIKEKVCDIYDYIIIIRSDNFNVHSLRYLSKHSHHKLVSYLWDSVNMPKSISIRKSRHLFSDIFCFDKNSIINYPDLRLKYETNFYYPVAQIEQLKKDLPVKHADVISYVGNIADRRDRIITEILDNINFQKAKINLDISIVKHDLEVDTLENKYAFNYLQNGISIHDYLKITLNSTIVLDIQAGWQNGFTFRIIEASYLKKKVITTNQFAKELKFYHPDNIFIYNQETKKSLQEFIEKPFFDIDHKNIGYYRIDNWLTRILRMAEQKSS